MVDRQSNSSIFAQMNANETSLSANSRLKRIQIVSGIFRAVFFAVTLICCVGGVVIVPTFFLSGPAKVVVLTSAGVEWIFAIFAWCCYKLFAQYASGDLFTARIVSSIRRVAYAYIFMAVAGGICRSILVHALKSTPHSAPAAAVSPSWSLSIFSLAGSLLPALLIIFIAWVMDEGRKIQEERELTV
jgi:hypothetical protein